MCLGKKTLRIAMLSVHTSPVAALGGKETGGMNVYVRELSRELGRRGFVVDIFTRHQDPAQPRIQQVWPRVRVINLPAGPLKPYPKGQVYEHLPAFVLGIKELAAQEGITYDLIHSHYWLSGWVAQKLQEEWQTPIIHMFHTLGRMKDAVARNTSEKEVDIRSRVEQQIMSGVNYIVAATPLDKEQMAQLYQVERDKVVVIPCGVDAEMFHPIPKAEAKAHLGGPIAERRMILFVGRLDPVKGLDTLLEAMCELAHADAKWAQTLCLAVIGGDAESASEALDSVECLDDLKRRFDLSELVIFLGSQEQSTLAYYYSAAEICVMPSRYESFGMVALEAMACGTPVLASRVGGLTYTVQDGVTGLLVPESDPKALARGLKTLLEDATLRERMGKQALAASRQYSWRRVAEQIAALYMACEHKANKSAR